MMSQQLMSNVNFSLLSSKRLPPPLVPNCATLNCDPTYELEEMVGYLDKEGVQIGCLI